MARTLNLARRQLDREQKSRIIAYQFRETPERSAQWIVKMFGVSDNSVTSGRDKFQSTGEILQVETTVSQDGKYRPISFSSPVNHERYGGVPKAALPPRCWGLSASH